jgi:hypothetical protein
MDVFWDMMPCSLAEDYHCCGGKCFSTTEVLISSIQLEQNQSETFKIEATDFLRMLATLQGSTTLQLTMQ